MYYILVHTGLHTNQFNAYQITLVMWGCYAVETLQLCITAFHQWCAPLIILLLLRYRYFFPRYRYFFPVTVTPLLFPLPLLDYTPLPLPLPSNGAHHWLQETLKLTNAQ